MVNYSRGWKDSHSRSPYFQKIEQRFQRAHQHSPSRVNKSSSRNLKKGLRTGLSLVWQGIRWLLRPRNLWKRVILLGIAGGLLLFIIIGAMFVFYSFNLPNPTKLLAREVPESTKILDRQGKTLYEIHGEENRTILPLAQIPEFTKQAFIAIEDKNFYKHGGISFTGIIRSALRNMFTGSRVGGSTITQQFVRNAVLSREKTYSRKFKEVVISLQLERRYNKNEILQLYLNEIPFGSNAYGIESASQTFFNKPAQDLSLAESAYLAALPQAPTYYSPYGLRKDELDSRADTVLQLMFEQGYITTEQRNQAQNQLVEFKIIGRGIKAPHFVLYVQDLLAQKYGEISLQDGGLKVTTTLDLDLQTIAEESIARQVAINEKTYNAGNASLVALDPRTGQILALVGSRDYFDEKHDGAVNVALRQRQPGSSFKPYVYATALKEGMNPATMLMDVITNFGEFGGKEYVPQNYDGIEHGPVSIRTALQGSLNIPAVKTLLLVGIPDAIDTAEDLGITTLKDRSRYGPSLVLGGGEVKLLDHTAAFGVFANNGTRHEPTTILKVEDKKGKILEEFQESRGKEVLDPQVAYQINNILSDNSARTFVFGSQNRLTLPGRAVAAKTGTTQEFRDAWTIGYVPSLAAGVWVGNNDNTPMKSRADGSVVAAPIWNEFMRRALEKQPAENFAQPSGIVEMNVDTLSGKLPTEFTQSTKPEVFASFNTPKETDDVHLAGGFVALYSEKPGDPLWDDPVRRYAESHNYIFAGSSGNPSDQNSAEIAIQIKTPATITALPWEIAVEITAPQDITQVELFMDNQLLTSRNQKKITYQSSQARVNGAHQILVQARASNGKVNKKTATLTFGLGQTLSLITPLDNQELRFPTNVVLESTDNIAPENARFLIRSASGKEAVLAGSISKQTLGSIHHYTLNWAESQKPDPGSYALYGQIGGTRSNEVVIKIP